MNRWVRLVGSVIAMCMIANLQYSWTLFVKPIMGATGWKLSQVQWGFTLFIALETWVQPFVGRFMDRLGPRIFMSVAAVMCLIGWAGMGQAHTLTQLYVLYSVAGIGGALVYCGSTIVGLKWFPDKLGLSSGLIAAGFGSGAALFTYIIAYTIRVGNYRSAFLYTGIGQGIVIFLVSQFMVNPDPNDPQIAGKKAGSKYKLRAQAEQFTSSEMLCTPQFYMLYAMMLMMGIGGLMVTAQLASVADTLGIAKVVFTLAVFINSLANGAGRIFWGWVSDNLGRERTMIIAFMIQALALVTVLRLGRNSPFWFVVLMALVLFTWGEIYSLFPATMADFFGIRNSGSNYAFLYSSKGVASILAGGLAALLFEKTGTWTVVFYGSAALAFITSVMAGLLITVPLPSKMKEVAPPSVAVKNAEPVRH
ncbi:MAG TPA: oxalate/formate MFS antiporter [Candidatus Acidoferrales bacterium]|nr:oxalate/formate MFS antiporter [Candidatus Acidoferrales bacterium]